MGAPISDEEEREIAQALRDGKKPDQIRKETGRGKSVIYRIMESIGLSNGPSGPTVRTKKATEAKINYDRERRLGLNNKFFKRLDEFVDNPITARDFKELMVAYGILEDKRQLLEPIKPDGTNGKAAIVAYVESELAKHEASRTEP